jgi:hypothetical protein
VQTCAGLKGWGSVAGWGPGVATSVLPDGQGHVLVLDQFGNVLQMYPYAPVSPALLTSYGQDTPLNYRGTTLAAGSSLAPGDFLADPGATTILLYEQNGSGNLGLYDNASGTLIWSASWHAGWTGGAAPSAGAGELKMQVDGNLVAYDGSGKPYWSSNTNTGSPGGLVVKKGMFQVVSAANPSAVWATYDYNYSGSSGYSPTDGGASFGAVV